MSKKCELTGKIPLKGHKVSHANNKTKRRFLPNLKKVNFKSDILKKNMKLNVSNAALRSVDKKGSFDQFIKTSKTRDLSLRLKKLKKILLSKSAYSGIILSFLWAVSLSRVTDSIALCALYNTVPPGVS